MSKSKQESRKHKDDCHDECNSSEKFDKLAVHQLKAKFFKANEACVNKLSVQQLFINGKPFPTPTPGNPYIITETTTIVGDNVPDPECEEGCGTATPGTPTGGIFSIGESFTGKITFCNVKSFRLNLNYKVVTNTDDYVLEIINCNQAFINGGTLVAENHAAVHISCSTNIEFRYLTIYDSGAAFLVENSQNVQLLGLHVENISEYAIRFENSNYIRLVNWDVSRISNYTAESLITGIHSSMIFLSDMVFFNINVTDIESETSKNIIKFDDCFDVKISHISVLLTSFTAVFDTNLNVYLVYFTNCGSLVLGSFIMDGDFVAVSGGSTGTFNCLRLENCNNTFTAHCLMTDNYIQGDTNAAGLSFAGIYVDNLTTATFNGHKICTNYASGGGNDSTISVRSFYGNQGGNWYFSGNICNGNYIENNEFLPGSGAASVYGFEIVDIFSSLTMQRCSSNNHGAEGASEVGGYKIYGIDADNNTNTNIDIANCSACQNFSNGNVGTTVGFLVTYSNTEINISEAISNFAGASCYGFLLPGIQSTPQLTVTIGNCSSNTNFSANGAAYGLYAGTLDGPILNLGETQGVQTLSVSKCVLNANGPPTGSNPPNPGYGAYLSEVSVSAIEENLFNQNNWGLYVDGGDSHNIYGNSAIFNDTGFEINEAPGSIIEENLAQANFDGFVDNTPTEPGNSYFSNNAVNNDTTSFENVTPCVVPWFAFDPADGSFTPTGPAVDPVLTGWSNISS